jgi:hypothetical protein
MTVAQWLEKQGVAEYNRHNDQLMELISLKNQILPGKLSGALSDIFYLALYDIDTFREQIQDQGLLDCAAISPALMTVLLSSDTTLLGFGIAWVKHQVFGRELDVNHLEP